jgi:hypothetical protein
MFRKRKRPPSGPTTTAHTWLLSARAVTGDDVALNTAIGALLEAGGFDAQQLDTEETFLLGQLLVRRFDITGSLNDLQWGLNYLLRATETTPSGSPDRGPRLQYLAETLLQAVEIMEPGEALELVTSHLNVARNWLTESLALAGPDRRATCRSSLGRALLLRTSYLGEADAVHAALAELRGACDEPADQQIKAACYGNYGQALMSLGQPGKSGHSEEGIAVFRQALALCPLDSPDRLAHVRNLISALDMTGRHDEAMALRHELTR